MSLRPTVRPPNPPVQTGTLRVNPWVCCSGVLNPTFSKDHCTMKLIGSETSPYVRKVRIVMAEKKLEYVLVPENPWSAESRLQEHNPLGKLPCLLIDEDESLFDSRVIVDYLDTLSPVGRLLPPPGRERASVKCWEAAGDGILDAAVSIIIEQRYRQDTPTSPWWIERQRGKIHAALDFMEKRLPEDTFCMGIHFSLADVGVGCALGYLDFRFADLNWRREHPKLQSLYEKLMTRPSFQQTVPPVAV